MFDFNLKNYGFSQLIAIIILNIMGLIFIQSSVTTNVNSFMSQLLISIFSLIICLIISFIDLKKLMSRPQVFHMFSIILLILVLILGNTSGRNSQRWILIPGINMQLQPSELAKLFLILYTSAYIEKVDKTINNFLTLLRLVALSIIPIVLVFLQPNLSSSLILAVIFLALLYGSKLRAKWFIMGAGILVAILGLMFASVKFNFIEKMPLLKEYQKQRIISFMTPTTKDEGKYQQENSIIAIGSGKLLGKGIKNDSNQSVKNGNWLAEEQNDFIFAVVGEEIGFLGSAIIIGLYLFLIISCLYFSTRTRSEMEKLICIGVGAWLGFQSFVNIGVATSIIPNTGVPLPFFSQGGSSLLAIYMAFGFVLNIKRRIR